LPIPGKSLTVQKRDSGRKTLALDSRGRKEKRRIEEVFGAGPLRLQELSRTSTSIN